MKGVSMIRVTYRPHAYCVGGNGDDPGLNCTFDRQASTFLSAATVRAEAQRHVQRTGHTVLVDVVDRTDYAPEPAEVTP